MNSRKKLLILVLVIFIVVIAAIFAGYFYNNMNEKQQIVHSIPASAKILFVSNKDTGSRAKEIYSMDENGAHITRITYSNHHHRVVGIDKTKRYLVSTCVEKDTSPPAGLGDEDRKTLWILDLKTGSGRRLTEPENNAEGDSFSPMESGSFFTWWLREKTKQIYTRSKEMEQI